MHYKLAIATITSWELVKNYNNKNIFTAKYRFLSIFHSTSIQINTNVTDKNKSCIFCMSCQFCLFVKDIYMESYNKKCGVHVFWRPQYPCNNYYYKNSSNRVALKNMNVFYFTCTCAWEGAEGSKIDCLIIVTRPDNIVVESG